MPGSVPVDENEAAFQVSFKSKVWEELGSDRVNLWLGYTQRSFWQVCNDDDSAPLRDTGYEPVAIVSVRTDVDVQGLPWRLLNLGHGDLTVTYRVGSHQFGLLARQNFSSGYGYNLLDYNHRQTVGGIGVLLTDRF